MTQSAKRRPEPEAEPVRVLGRGIRAARGVHLTLRTLRDAVGKTQVDIAKQSQIDQATSPVSNLDPTLKTAGSQRFGGMSRHSAVP